MVEFEEPPDRKQLEDSNSSMFLSPESERRRRDLNSTLLLSKPETLVSSSCPSNIFPAANGLIHDQEQQQQQQHRTRRRRLARRRAYNRSHRRHRSSRNLFVSYADNNNNADQQSDNFFLGGLPMAGNGPRNPPPLSYMHHPYQFYQEPVHLLHHQEVSNLATSAGCIESGPEFVSEPEPEFRESSRRYATRKLQRILPSYYRPFALRQTNNSKQKDQQISIQQTSTHPNMMSNQYVNYNNEDFATNAKLDIGSRRSPINRHHHQFAFNELNASGSLDSAAGLRANLVLPITEPSSSSLSPELAASSSCRGSSRKVGISRSIYHLTTTRSTQALDPTTNRSHLQTPTHQYSSSSLNNNNKLASFLSTTPSNQHKTNTNFFSSLLGSMKRLELSSSNNELVLDGKRLNSSDSLMNVRDLDRQQRVTSAISPRASSPAALEKTRRLSKSSMRIEMLANVQPQHQTNNTSNKKQSMSNIRFFGTSSQQNKSLQHHQTSSLKSPLNLDSQQPKATKSNSIFGETTTSSKSHHSSLGIPRSGSESFPSNCSLDSLCRAISLESPPSSSYVLSELAISQLRVSLNSLVLNVIFIESLFDQLVRQRFNKIRSK